jgi:hypothetical protein
MVMVKALIKGGVLGGLVVFIWGAISWMVLPWHLATLYKFKDEQAVTEILTANAPASGVFVLPNAHRHEPGMSEEEMAAAEEAGLERMMKGPFVFASVRLGSGQSMGTLMLNSLLIQILGALLVTWLVMKTGSLGYVSRVIFVTVFAVAAGVITHLPYWNWWDFSTGFTVVALADLVIGWFLAGLVIAKVTTVQAIMGAR